MQDVRPGLKPRLYMLLRDQHRYHMQGPGFGPGRQADHQVGREFSLADPAPFESHVRHAACPCASCAHIFA